MIDGRTYWDSSELRDKPSEARNILDILIQKTQEQDEKILQGKLKEENDKNIEIMNFRKIMKEFHSWTAYIKENTFILINEDAFPQETKEEIIYHLEKYKDSEEEEKSTYTESGKHEYTVANQETLNNQLQNFGLELREKYRVEEDEYEDDGYLFYPVIWIKDLQKFISFLQKITNDEEELNQLICTAIYWLKEQLMEKNIERAHGFRDSIIEMHKQLIRIWVRDHWDFEENKSVLSAEEEWYLEELTKLYDIWFNIIDWQSKFIRTMTENLPTFFLEMLSSSEHEENVNQVDIYIKFKRDQQEIQEAITLLRTLKHCDKVFFRARTYLLSGLTAILERLPECKIFWSEQKKEIEEEIKNSYYEILDM